MSTAEHHNSAIKSALLDLATTFRLSALFFASLELDIYSHIPDQGVTAEKLASAVGGEELPLRLVLNALVGMGVLAKQGDRFYLPVAHSPFLCRGPSYMGDQLLLHKEQADNWLNMAEVIRSQSRRAGQPYFDQLLSSTRVRQYLASVEEANRPYAELMLERLRSIIPSLRRALDIAGGHGYYARRLLEMNSAITVTLLDVEKTIDYCREQQRGHPGYARLKLLVGDALTQDFEGQFDLVMINDLLHYFARDEKREVLRRGIRALEPGGTIVVSKFRLEDSGTEPGHSALFSLKIYMDTYRGYEEPDCETMQLLQEAGAHDIHMARLGEDRTLITAVR